MSGGDSSVAALLLSGGWEVIGTRWPVRLFAVTRDGRDVLLADDLYDARRVCDTLGIPYYVLNLRDNSAGR